MAFIQRMIQTGIRDKFLLVSVDKYSVPDGVDRVPYIITREKRPIYGNLIDMFIDALSSSPGAMASSVSAAPPSNSPMNKMNTLNTASMKPTITADTKSEIQPIDVGMNGFTYLDEDVSKKSEMNSGASVLGFVYLEDGATSTAKNPPAFQGGQATVSQGSQPKSLSGSYSSHVFTPTTTPSNPMAQEMQENPYGVSEFNKDKISEDAFKQFLEARNKALI